MGPKPRPLMDRFNESWTPEPNSGCWLWLRAVDRKGYGWFVLKGNLHVFAHRWIFQTVNGPIPDGLQIDHLCRVHSCVNPAHLEAVTPRENLMRGRTLAAANAAKTHCIYGHEFDSQNTSITRSGHRRCRKCSAVQTANYRKKREELHG